jgi:hypothetical protein
MYLDPGSASLFIQGVFAVIATVLALFTRSRIWLVAMWSRAVGSIARLVRRRSS